MWTQGKLRLYAAVAAFLTSAVCAVVWFWLQGDSDEKHETKACWRILGELGTHSSGSIGSCGDALESAMTGKPAGSKATDGAQGATIRLAEEQSQAFEHVVNVYANRDVKREPMPSGILMNMANALTYYRDDVSQILSAQVDYSNPAFSTEPNDIDIDTNVMREFLTAVAKDEAAFGLVRESMFGLVTQQVNELEQDDFARKPQGDRDHAYGVARSAGSTLGALRQARFDALKAQDEGSGALKEALAGKDYAAYRYSRLEQLIRSRASSLAVPETPESKSRLEDILSRAQNSYR
ncbi:hypothetical protein ACFW2T_19610 [Streptomyces sp. NPDC058892]|uniref:hypothetical protein n=1 Tax=unclassified Streptomyces TaxID=2593676 RepID=UPI0036CA7100